jgi:hypothetical protein
MNTRVILSEVEGYRRITFRYLPQDPSIRQLPDWG